MRGADACRALGEFAARHHFRHDKPGAVRIGARAERHVGDARHRREEDAVADVDAADLERRRQIAQCQSCTKTEQSSCCIFLARICGSAQRASGIDNGGISGWRWHSPRRPTMTSTMDERSGQHAAATGRRSPWSSSPPAAASAPAGGGPKQYRRSAARPVIARTLETFLAHPRDRPDRRSPSMPTTTRYSRPRSARMPSG